MDEQHDTKPMQRVNVEIDEQKNYYSKPLMKSVYTADSDQITSGGDSQSVIDKVDVDSLVGSQETSTDIEDSMTNQIDEAEKEVFIVKDPKTEAVKFINSSEDRFKIVADTAEHPKTDYFDPSDYVGDIDFDVDTDSSEVDKVSKSQESSWNVLIDENADIPVIKEILPKTIVDNENFVKATLETTDTKWDIMRLVFRNLIGAEACCEECPYSGYECDDDNCSDFLVHFIAHIDMNDARLNYQNAKKYAKKHGVNCSHTKKAMKIAAGL